MLRCGVLLMVVILTLSWVSGILMVEIQVDCDNNGNKINARSCKELRDKYNINQDGIYTLTTASGTVYQTFCDMTTAGGGWTLVASVHENNLYGKCTEGDRWTSQQGNHANRPEGDGNWANRNTFGTAEGATSDDFKNPGYFDLEALDVSVWHVPNNSPVVAWRKAAILRYHTCQRFLVAHGGNLYELFKKYPVRFNAGACRTNNGPSIPVVYDYGSKLSNDRLFGPYSRKISDPGYITFRAINTERAPTAICSGLRPSGCHTEHFCVGGSGYFPEAAPRQCGDFTSYDWDGYATHRGWSASRAVTEAALMLFYR